MCGSGDSGGVRVCGSGDSGGVCVRVCGFVFTSLGAIEAVGRTGLHATHLRFNYGRGFFAVRFANFQSFFYPGVF